jgi:TRAP-type C4-dicarboxylate transport system substrate-binding protein
MRSKFLTLAGAAALALCSTTASSQTQIKFASFVFPQAELNTNVFTPFVTKFNEEMKGTAEIKLFAGGTLGRDPAQQYKLVRDNVAEMAYIVQGYTPGDFPDVTMFDLPFIIENSMEGSVGHWRMHEKGLMRGYDKIKVVSLFTLPAYSLHTVPVLTKLDDIKGLKVRSTGSYQGAAIEALGGTAVGGILITQVAEALSRGVIQGSVADYGGMAAFKYDSISKNHLDVPMGTAAAGVVMNLDAWNGLPANARAAFDKGAGLAMARVHGFEFDKQYNTHLTRMKEDASHKFLQLSAAERDAVKKRMQPVIDMWIKEDPGNKARYDAMTAIVEDIRKGK